MERGGWKNELMTHPFLGGHHFRPLTDQLFHNVKLPSEERVLLHVHLVDVHLQKVQVKACQKGFMTKLQRIVNLYLAQC